jgi:hypothetical protein
VLDRETRDVHVHVIVCEHETDAFAFTEDFLPTTPGACGAPDPAMSWARRGAGPASA